MQPRVKDLAVGRDASQFLGAGDFSPDSSQPFENFITSPFCPKQPVLLLCCCLSHTIFFCLVSCIQTYCCGSSPPPGTCSLNSISLCPPAPPPPSLES